jgi:hypothetical protein
MRWASLTAMILTAAFRVPISAQAPGVDARIETILTSVSSVRLHEYLKALTDLETRHSLSFSDRAWGVIAAREYILETMQSFSNRLEVALDCYRVEPQGRIPEEAELCNVEAVLPGKSARRIYVSGHYDTVARPEAAQFDWTRYDNPAPGANDDGSGTVLTMEVHAQRHPGWRELRLSREECACERGSRSHSGARTDCPRRYVRSGPMLSRGSSGYDAALRWNPSPGAIGYRIVWREAWTPDWQFEVLVGDVTEHVLADISIDDYVFGVAAIGPGGHESVVSAYVRPPRARSDIREVGDDIGAR